MEKQLRVTRRLLRIGNSIGITIPRRLLRALAFEPGDELVLSARDEGVLTVERRGGQKKAATAEMNVSAG